MKLMIAAVIACLAIGCTTETDHGECVGLMDEKNPALKYEVDMGNLLGGALFFGLIVPPVYVAITALECPVGPR